MLSDTRPRERGSALVMSFFVLTLISLMGLGLMSLGVGEIRMARASLRPKLAFFVAEGALEDGRATLYETNRNGSFSDDLLAASGPNGAIDFDPSAVVPLYDADGNLVGFGGVGDDVPLRAATLGSSYYEVYLTNDPLDLRHNLADGNDRVLLTGIGVARDRSWEMVQAIVEMESILPTSAPATITLLGPQPLFESANSRNKAYLGDDCAGAGLPGHYVPVVGTVGPSAEAAAEAGLQRNPDFVAGGYSDEDTFADLTDAAEPTVSGSGYGTIDPAWTDCASVIGMVESLRQAADALCLGPVRCSGGSSCPCDPATTTPNSITFVEGDFDLGGNAAGQGTLVVTGTATFGGDVSWDGLVLVLGEGSFRLNGSGSGRISGGVIVADVAGPDGFYGGFCSPSAAACASDSDCPPGESCMVSNDNCSGDFGSVSFDERGGGNSGTIYCTTDLDRANPVHPYRIVDFKQW